MLFVCRNILYVFLIFVTVASCKKIITEHAQTVKPLEITEDTSDLKNYNKDLTVVNWNIEWFGLQSNGTTGFKGNLDVQESNAVKILKYLNADLYGICEVVDTARFGKMIRNNLGDAFRYTISYYPTSLGSQKLAYVYNRNIFRNVKLRPFMGLSANAYYYFAQRFPFLLTADVVVNGRRTVVNYFLLHAKANADLDSYNRRLYGAAEMKDSLSKYFSGQNVMIIGDYNDKLYGSIYLNKASPYENFLTDENYNAITLPLNSSGYQSTISYANSVIDQQMINTNMNKWYVGASAAIRKDVTNPVPDYNSGNTSDHYPVSSVFKF